MCRSVHCPSTPQIHDNLRNRDLFNFTDFDFDGLVPEVKENKKIIVNKTRNNTKHRTSKLKLEDIPEETELHVKTGKENPAQCGGEYPDITNMHYSSVSLLLVSITFFQIQTKVLCYQYKVGDLHAWGIPTSPNSQVYHKWSKYHNLNIGDSLLFLYPPSEDSVIQLTEESYKRCNLKDPILYMNNGNSLFNITSEGEFYFTSGVVGHCQKNQKLHISVYVNSGAYAPNSLPEYAPLSYPLFGTIPDSPSNSAQLSSNFLVIIIIIIGFYTSTLLSTVI